MLDVEFLEELSLVDPLDMTLHKLVTFDKTYPDWSPDAKLTIYRLGKCMDIVNPSRWWRGAATELAKDDEKREQRRKDEERRKARNKHRANQPGRQGAASGNNAQEQKKRDDQKPTRHTDVQLAVEAPPEGAETHGGSAVGLNEDDGEESDPMNEDIELNAAVAGSLDTCDGEQPDEVVEDDPMDIFGNHSSEDEALIDLVGRPLLGEAVVADDDIWLPSSAEATESEEDNAGGPSSSGLFPGAASSSGGGDALAVERPQRGRGAPCDEDRSDQMPLGCRLRKYTRDGRSYWQATLPRGKSDGDGHITRTRTITSSRSCEDCAALCAVWLLAHFE